MVDNTFSCHRVLREELLYDQPTGHETDDDLCGETRGIFCRIRNHQNAKGYKERLIILLMPRTVGIFISVQFFCDILRVLRGWIVRSDIISGYNTNIVLNSNISIMETRKTQIQPKFRFTLSTKINDITSHNILY